MPVIVGTDEAGYGPNFGPLTVCGTAWVVPDTRIDLYEALAQCVCGAESKPDPNRLAICDSKLIYSPSGSIEPLERMVLSILVAHHGELPESSDRLGELLGIDFCSYSPESTVDGANNEELSGFLTLPLAANSTDILRLGNHFLSECEDRQVKLSDIECEAVKPEQFNQLVNHLGNKAELLSATTLRIVKQLTANLDDATLVVCDKHGGRSKYAALLNHHLTDQFVQINCESRAESCYHWIKGENKFEIQFRTGGESFLPTALASMIAKYVREVAMEIWNTYWETKVPGIRPTRGYPADAKRFKKEIAAVQTQLGIPDDQIWRKR